jgi:ubiquinone/menaquinone biosynthesis C-methylase UbiE
MPEVEHELEKGFTEVDAQPDVAYLLAAMDATATWPAVRHLRARERERLALAPGDRLLDVGCGLGDVAMALAPAVAPGGEVIGVDVSESMLAVARQRAAASGVAVTFRTADALALDEPSASFDAVRSERVLQWLPDVEQAIREIVRVLRPGGRLSLIDTDWRTFAVDLDDVEAADAVMSAMTAFRGDGMRAGGRLLNLCREHGLADLECTAAAHVWTRWDPDTEPGPSGLFPIRTVVPQLVDAGLLDAGLATRFVDAAVDAGRRGRICFSLTMLGVTGRR